MKRSADNDDDDVQDLSESNPVEGPPTKKKQKSKQKNSSHDFSTKEIARLQENETVFHSSLFKLQITELLKEVSLKQKLKRRIQDAIDSLSKLVEKLPEGKEHKIIDRKWLEKSGVKVPLVEKPSEVKGNFQFKAPSSIKLIGGFLLNTVVKPDIGARLALYIPKSCFDKKDYLNYRCIRKQALYLAHVASRLNKKKQIESLQFSYYQGNPLKPILLVAVKGQDGKSIKVELHAILEFDTFKLSRFQVDKNNIRPKWYFEKSSKSEETETDPSALPATPFYNMSLASDLCTEENNEFVERILSESEGVRQGIILLKVWLRQRELLTGWGSFSSDLLTSYVAYLTMKKKINKLMNSYQIFRTTLLFLSRADWTVDPPSLKEDNEEESSQIESFKSQFSCVFVDRTGYVNLAYMISTSMFSRVKDEAKSSLSALDQVNHRSFDVLFMTPKSFPRTFDYIFHLNISPDVFNSASSTIADFDVKSMDHGSHQSLVLQTNIEEILTKALGDRIKLLQLKPPQPPPWSVTGDPYQYDDEKKLTFGICLNAVGAFAALNKGPTADAPESKEFREFWGEKSEMRRFKDGTIHEAVLWTSSSLQSDRRLVCKKIIQHILERHCGVNKSCVNYVGAQFDSLLQGSGSGTGEELSLNVLKAFEDVSRAVRGVSSLPLSIHSVQGTHPVFRHADVFPAIPTVGKDMYQVKENQAVPEEGKALPPYVPALTVVCMLEGSGKWPEDRDAIQCLKSLLHVKMAAELKEKHRLPVSVSRSYVDVLKDGFVFRLHLANTREIAVLRTITSSSGMVKFRDTEEAVHLEKTTVNLPRLTHLLHSIQQENPAFSAAVRLCKRWIASQMLWDYLTDEAIELMIAYIYITPHPYTPPSSPVTGLLRFLNLLSSFSWKTDPLMVNLNKEFTEEDMSSIPKEISKHRVTLPAMVIVTPQDKKGTQWTKPQPSQPILQRLVIIAKESLRILETQIMSASLKEDFKLVFRPPLENFDLVIRLIKKVNLLHYQAVTSKTESPSAPSQIVNEPNHAIPIVEFNVCRKFFTDVKACFGDIALFFYDPYGGDSIGMVWKQQCLQAMEFKASNFNHRNPTIDDSEKMMLNIRKEAILDNIRVMGGGIIESIQNMSKEL